jgi:hypothetical protein
MQLDNINISRRKKRIGSEGYVLLYIPEHPKSFDGGWYYEHRVILEINKKRFLNTWETIHHINGNKQDNRVENLFACTSYQHKKAHRS